MPKLMTPIQYEPSLEGLNAVRPLQLLDEGKSIISYPVLCKNAPSEGRPAIGKFARCSQQGALLKKSNTLFHNLESNFFPISENTPLEHYIFQQKVYKVTIRYTDGYGTTGVWWCNYDGSIHFTELPFGVWMTLPFVGRSFHIVGEGVAYWQGTVILFGFY